MTMLIAGITLFILIHFVPVFKKMRLLLVNSFGEKGYKIAFTLISFATLGLMGFGKAGAEFTSLYDPPVWGRHAAWLMMLIAFVLLASAQGPSAFRTYLKHPMLLGVVVWGAGHLLVNGDLASVVLFGGMAGFSAVMIALLFMRDGVGAAIAFNWRSTVKQSLAGVLIYLAIMLAHPYLFGVAVI